MGRLLFANNAGTTLASGIAAGAATLDVGDATEFPVIAAGSGDYFYTTIVGNSGVEVLKVTGKSGSTFTVTRGEDGTSPLAFDAGERVELRNNAAMFRDLQLESIVDNGTGIDVTGTVTADGGDFTGGAFTSTGIDDNATSTAITIDASENVGFTNQNTASNPVVLDSNGKMSSNSTTKGLYEHANTISANYTIATGNNALTVGPITINTGISVSIPSGSTWVVA
jgi:hypothetical protein